MGIVSRKEAINIKRFNKMHESLAHRGPDDSGSWTSPDRRTALGHKRLSIIDLTEGGHQPMVSENGRYILVYNGEIYNYRELRTDLEKEGICFKTESDTEVLLQLWEKVGKESLIKIRGMFAFSIWDSEARILFLSRDPFGIKPLYFCSTQDYIAFASEMKAFTVGGIAGGPDPKAIGSFLQWGSIPAPLTLYKDVVSLKPGQWIEWEQNTGIITDQIYWNYNRQLEIEQNNQITDFEEAVNLMRQTLYDSVKAHLVSDVPVGAFLSGGIDSTAIVSLMRQAGQDHISTFSITFDDENLDESYFSQLAARTYNTDHHEWRISREEFNNLKDKFMKSIDSPTIDGLNTWIVARFAREHGLKVVTSGVGGDEFFYGYPNTFKQLPVLMKCLGIVPAFIKKLLNSTMNNPYINNLSPNKINKMSKIIEVSPDLKMGYLFNRGLFTKYEVEKLIKDKDLAMEAASLNMAAYLPEIEGNVTEQQIISILETSRYLGSQLLPDSDQFSMAHALELRVPLVDRIVAENLCRINSKFFYDKRNTAKALLVNAVGDLPDKLVYRKKQGFTLPVSNWIINDNWEPKSRLLDLNACKKIHSDFQTGRIHWSRRWGIEVLDNILTGIANV